MSASVGRPVRKKKLTKQGETYTLQLLVSQSKHVHRRLKKQRALFDDLLKTNNIEMVDRELVKLDTIFNELLENLAQIREISPRENEDLVKLAVLVDKEDSEVFQIKGIVAKWMASQIELFERESVASKQSSRHTRSIISHRTRRSSSLISRRSDASDLSGVSRTSQKAKVAGLKAEVDVLKTEGEAEIAENICRMEDEINRYRIEQKANLKAEIAVKEGIIANNEVDIPILDEKKTPADKHERSLHVDPLKMKHGEAKKINEKIVSVNNNFEELSRSMIKMIKTQSAPKVDIDVFSGDPLDYCYFITNFKDMVESVVDDQKGRLARLIKFTSGEVKELIKHCVYNDSENCYDVAVALLNKEYGDPFRVSCAYIEKLKNWPVIKYGDGSGLKCLYRFLLQCQTYQKRGSLTSLDTPLTIRSIQLKLPFGMQDKWTSLVGKIRKHKKREANFCDFVEFIDVESCNLNDPVYSRGGLNDQKKERVEERSRFNTYYTQQTENPPHVPENPQTINDACPFCKNLHDLDDCPQFIQKNMKDRKQFIFENKLCFACYGSGHIANNCIKRKTCKVCNLPHPTALHIYKVNATQNQGDGDVSGMCIVPVRLLHKDHPDKELLVYAMLDECSQGTFIKEDVMHMFGDVKSRRTTITVNTLNGQETKYSLVAEGFSVICSKVHEKEYEPYEIKLPHTYSCAELPFDHADIPTKEFIEKWSHLDSVSKTSIGKKDIPFGLLIGRNCPKSMEPLEVIPSRDNGPYAYRTRLGWCIGGIDSNINNNSMKVNSVQARWPAKDIATGSLAKHCFQVNTSVFDIGINESLKEMWSADVVESDSDKISLSNEDRMFLKIMKENICLKNGHYELPLPFRDGSPTMPCNRKQAVKRAEGVKKKMLKEKEFCEDYTKFMQDLIDKGYAKKANGNSLDEQCWYLPHHAVYHPTKKKIRVVFDCSAEFNNVSLNSLLLQGPDLTNLLIGVLLRFRKELVPFMADVESMYHQVRVPEEQRKYLRFVWWQDGNLGSPLEDFEMCVHVFGAISSLGCVNYALRQTAIDNEKPYGVQAAKTVTNDFYVDDMLKSVNDELEAISLIRNIIYMCKAGGFNLTKFVCTKHKVMETIPIQKHSEKMIKYNFGNTDQFERPLGVHWSIENDTFGFCITFKSNILTRRGILATISGIYDALGFAAPFLLKGRKILQEITAEKVSWDEDVSEIHVNAWNIWKKDLPLLEQLTVSRCYKPSNFQDVVDVSLHCFADASLIGYGASCYLRQVDKVGNIAVSLVMGKSRVSSLKPITIDRLELSAATVTVTVGNKVTEELDFNNMRCLYYTDNKVVLGYICNDVKRFKVYVANRTQMIRKHTTKRQWSYVCTEENPADHASRGLTMKQEDKVKTWLYGPDFLWKPEENWSQFDAEVKVSDEDPEIAKGVSVCHVTVGENNDLLERLETRISGWNKMKRVMAFMILFINKTRKLVSRTTDKLVVEDIQTAERTIIKMCQYREFHKEISELNEDSSRKAKTNLKLSKLRKLDPFVDNNGLLRVGGRLAHSDFGEGTKFPVILPKKAIISSRIVEYYHRIMEHTGRASTTNEIRNNGYWLIDISSKVRSIIYRCVRCRTLRGTSGSQKMANLPADRVQPEAPFTHCGVDMFGPFYVKEGRKELKRYCALFTCFSSKAVHIEVTTKMDTDAFIMALRRFIARRGPVRTIRSDNGGNFVGTLNELKNAYKEMDQSKISDFLNARNCDWFEWKRNTPVASHMGGIWERQIRTVRSVLNATLKSHNKLLDHESFCTLLTEVEAIVNSRPITLENLNDPESMPLTPNHLLTLKSKVVMPPPGVFQKNDVYCRKRWRVVQHMANVFWDRWRKEYLSTLQTRSKWTVEKRNFKIGDVVLLKDKDVCRNSWPMGVIAKTHPNEDGLVRSVDVKISGSTSLKKRPITELVLLLESNVDNELTKV